MDDDKFNNLNQDNENEEQEDILNSSDDDDLEESTEKDPEPIEKSLEEELKEAGAKLLLIQQETDKAIKKYTLKQQSSQHMATILRFLTLSLSAIVTIILGLNLEPVAMFNRIALSLSAITGVVSGLSAFFDFGALSVKYKDTLDKLGNLKLKTNYLSTGNEYVRLHEVNILKREYINVLNETYAFYQKMKEDELNQEDKEDKR